MPRRLVLSCPGCATKASTERSTRPPTAMRSSRTERGAGAAVGGLDRHRIGQHLDRQAGGLGILAAEHDRACAGIEHHGDRHAVDLRAHVEVARHGARDLDGAAMGDDVAGNKLRLDALGDLAQFEPVGVADHQDEAEHDPDQGGGECLGEALAAQQRQRGAAEKNEKRDLVGERGKILVRQRADGAFAVAIDENEEPHQNGGQHQPLQNMAHGFGPFTPSAAARRRRAAKRAATATLP